VSEPFDVEEAEAEAEESIRVCGESPCCDSARTILRLAQMYDDLIYQVANKWPGESRHETAKRYIMEREARSLQGTEAKAAGLLEE